MFWFEGMAGESIHVVGLRRIYREFVNCVIEIGVIENLRVTSIYSARKWAVLTRFNAELFQTKADADEYLDRCAHALRFEGPEKLSPVEKTGPWGPYESSAYRKK